MTKDIKRKTQLCNRPAPGSKIKVEPIRTLDDIARIRKLLHDNPRDLCLFNFGINTNLRAGDLVRLKVGQVKYLHVGEDFEIKEQKTKKLRRITINQTVYDSLRELCRFMPDAGDDEYLFQSRKSGGGKKPLSVSYVNALVKDWCRRIGLRGNYGSHTLRKTYGWVHYYIFGTPIPRLMRIYNHSSQQQTLDYLCIQDKEIKNDYMKEI